MLISEIRYVTEIEIYYKSKAETESIFVLQSKQRV